MMDEENAIELALQGRREGFHFLYDRYVGFLFTLARRMLRDVQLAEDATQEAFSSAFGGLHSFRGESRFKTWLYTIIYRIILKIQEKRVREVSMELSHLPNSNCPHSTLEKRLDVYAILDQLEPRSRAVLIMAYFDDLTCAEIAEILKLKTNHAKIILFRARVQFRKLVSKNCSNEEVSKVYEM